MHIRLAIPAIALSLAIAKAASAAPVEFTAFGDKPSDIQTTFQAFRDVLGHNNGIGGSFTSGHREINWDGVPDAVAAPNHMPANFFNVNSPRGAVFLTPGSGFQISAKAGNPTGTPLNFANINSGLSHQFQTFSPQRLFTALDSAVTETLFFQPGTNKPATVNAFGSVFTGVTHSGPTHIEYFDAGGALLHSQVVPASSHQGLSFAGTFFNAGEQVAMVRITSGNVELDEAVGLVPNPHGDDPADAVVMDDFIYGEPQPTVAP